MEKFIKHTGTAVPLRRSNVDTDQIIPAVYLKRVTRSGFEDGLFAAWRNDPEFVLNKTEFKAGTVLLAGADFGEDGSPRFFFAKGGFFRDPDLGCAEDFGDRGRALECGAGSLFDCAAVRFGNCRFDSL